ncbi:unnamed protein product [Symbiodinium natans]|uniref:Uncharacterized protein n=1 Tax=Symbiodinium natans TaxID=878477 RepID=A0A812U1F6_9DINO|nr:unnamed protein product [Symbiodinium natans]
MGRTARKRGNSSTWPEENVQLTEGKILSFFVGAGLRKLALEGEPPLLVLQNAHRLFPRCCAVAGIKPRPFESFGHGELDKFLTRHGFYEPPGLSRLDAFPYMPSSSSTGPPAVAETKGIGAVRGSSDGAQQARRVAAKASGTPYPKVRRVPVRRVPVRRIPVRRLTGTVVVSDDEDALPANGVETAEPSQVLCECGHANRLQAKFCEECGQSIKTPCATSEAPCATSEERSRSPRRSESPLLSDCADMPELVSLTFCGFEASTSSDSAAMIDSFCAAIANAQSAVTGVKAEEGVHAIRDLGCQEVAVEDICFCQRRIHPRKIFGDGRSMTDLVQELVQGRTKVDELPVVRLLQLRRQLITLDHRRVWCFKEYQRHVSHQVMVPAHVFELSNETIGFFEGILVSDIGTEFLQKFHAVRGQIS